MRPLVALALAAVLAAPGCSTSEPTTGAGRDGSCLQDVLDGYRSIAAPTARVVRGFGSIVRESAKLTFRAPVHGIRVTVSEIFDPPLDDVPAKLRPLLERVRSAFGETEDAVAGYRRSARRVARVAERCAASAGVDDPRCRAAVEEGAAAVRAGADALAGSARELRSGLRGGAAAGLERLGAGVERLGAELERHQARLQAAVAAAAGCV